MRREGGREKIIGDIMEEVIARSSMEQVPSSEDMEMSKDDNKKLLYIAELNNKNVIGI